MKEITDDNDRSIPSRPAGDLCDDVMKRLHPDVTSIILTRVDGPAPGVRLLRAQGVDRLISIAWQRPDDNVLRAWTAAGGDIEHIELIRIGHHTRGAADSERPALVRALPVDGLDRLPGMIEEMVDDGGGHAILLDQITDLLRHAGFDRTYTAIEGLLDAATRCSSLVVMSIHKDAPCGVPAGLAPSVECVLESIQTGESRMPQPAGTLGAMPTADRFELLRPARRRVLLRVLDTVGEIGIRPLARRLAEQPVGTDYLDSPERLAGMLYQVDLPMFAEADVIEFDADRGVVSLRLDAFQLWPFLELTRRMDGV